MIRCGCCYQEFDENRSAQGVLTVYLENKRQEEKTPLCYSCALAVRGFLTVRATTAYP